MHVLIRHPFYISLLFGALPARAEFRPAGIQRADHYSLAGQSPSLNGAGIRNKFFVKVYVGALCLEKATQEARQALQSTGPNGILMVMRYKEIGADTIKEGWRNGFDANLSAADMAILKTRLEQFDALFPAVWKGNHVEMEFVPRQGTMLNTNDEVRRQTGGDDFFTALLSGCLGKHPADSQLKNGLLSD